ncbi:MAG: endonuclease/exonuclease/phosphatase family protein [Saprospiraceae bacterium]|nr:endonuclease/exonuclease/phosphatase family protein [Saprospiraceae bacterium]
MRTFLRVVFLLNLIAVVIAILGYTGSYIDPHQFSLSQGAGLILPWTLLLVAIFAGFWLVLRDKRAWVSIICLVIGFFQIGRLVGFSFDQVTNEGELSILTYNSQSYNKANQISRFLSHQDLPSELKIICLQEISDEYIEEIKADIKMPNAFFYKGKMILTRYPVKAQGKIQFDASVNGCIWADLVIGNRTIRIYNVHLRSNGIPGQEESVLSQVTTKRGWQNISKMLGNYRTASKERVSQVRRILEDVKACPHPVVVAGDLNDTPFSFTYQLFADELIDQFRVKGLGIGSTYAGSIPGLKIDYIFADENFEPVGHQILRTRFSDHFPVVSNLRIDP